MCRYAARPCARQTRYPVVYDSPRGRHTAYVPARGSGSGGARLYDTRGHRARGSARRPVVPGSVRDAINLYCGLDGAARPGWRDAAGGASRRGARGGRMELESALKISTFRLTTDDVTVLSAHWCPRWFVSCARSCGLTSLEAHQSRLPPRDPPLCARSRGRAAHLPATGSRAQSVRPSSGTPPRAAYEAFAFSLASASNSSSVLLGPSVAG